MSTMSRQGPIRIGVIGLGFMGRTHVAAVQAAEAAGLPCRLVAVADQSASRRAGWLEAGGNLRTAGASRLFDPSRVAAHEAAQPILDSRDIDLVSLCTPTPTHVELALAALAAGKHVLVEKPLALNSRDVQRVAEAAGQSGRVCMPAMCMRFWPGWAWLKQTIESGRFGAVQSASFQRLAAVPDWSGFYRDPAASGGALFDLHIHDADFVLWCFGAPHSVAVHGHANHATTCYRFSGGPAHVVAEGGWLASQGFPFRMRYVVGFEQATAEFDLLRDQPLHVTWDGRAEAVKLEPLSGYDIELRTLVECLARGEPPDQVTVADALRVTRLLEAEQRSLTSGGEWVRITD